MSGHGMLKYFHPIAHKKDAPEDKDPPEGKELSNLSWPYLSKVIPPSSSLSIASYLYNAIDSIFSIRRIYYLYITRVLKQAKRSFYLKLLYKANSVQHGNVKFTSSQPSRAHYNPTIIYFTSASKNLTQFVKVLRYTVVYSYNFIC